MNKDRLLQIIDNPGMLEPVKDLRELKEMTANFPYFSAGYGLMASALHEQKSIYTADYIKVASLYTGDRQVLRELVEQRDRIPRVVRQAAETMRDIQGQQPDVMPGYQPEITTPDFPEVSPDLTPGTTPDMPEVQPDRQPEPEQQPIEEPITEPQPNTDPQPTTLPEPEPGNAPQGEVNLMHTDAVAEMAEQRKKEVEIPERDKKIDEASAEPIDIDTDTEQYLDPMQNIMEEDVEPTSSIIPLQDMEQDAEPLHEESADNNEAPKKASESTEGYEPTQPPQEPENPTTVPEPQRVPEHQPLNPGDDKENVDPKNPEKNTPSKHNEPQNTAKYSVLASTDYFAYLNKVGDPKPEPIEVIAQSSDTRQIQSDGPKTFVDWLKVYRADTKEWESTPDKAGEKGEKGVKQPKPGLENSPDTPEKPAPKPKSKPDLMDRLNAINWPPKVSRLMYKPAEMARMSDEEDTRLVSETLANIYIDQKLYTKAIETFQRLILKNPEKTAYFASKIAAVKEMATL